MSSLAGCAKLKFILELLMFRYLVGLLGWVIGLLQGFHRKTAQRKETCTHQYALRRVLEPRLQTECASDRKRVTCIQI